MKLRTLFENEALRESFRPERVRLLFIGEAPPASGRFFYARNSGLYRAMRQAFDAVNPQIPEEHFLTAFRESGCYLIDLCSDPVDRLDAASRRRARLEAEPLLAKKLIELQPEKIATLLHAIVANVDRATLAAKWSGQVIRLPYPGRWSHHRAEFVKAIDSTLRGLAH